MTQPDPNCTSEPGAGSGGGTSHDRLFKTLFEEFLGDLLELVHPELAATLDLDDFQPADKELYADFRKQGHVEADVVRQTSSRETVPQLVLVHVETEGEFLHEFDGRMERYNLHLTLKSDFPVISVAVFLTGGTPGIEVREVRRRVGPFEALRFQYFAFGLSGSLAEEYVDLPQPLAAALAALMRSRMWDNPERKIQCFEGIRRAEGLDIRQRFLLARVVDTYVQLNEREQERFEATLARAENKEVREMVVTWEEALAESRAEGEAQGEAAGRSLGQLEAAQGADLRAAERRFGALPQAFEQSIRATQDLDRLYEILDQILEAESLDEIDLG